MRCDNNENDIILIILLNVILSFCKRDSTKTNFFQNNRKCNSKAETAFT